MSAGSGEEAGKEPLSDLIDDLIQQLMKEPSRAPKEAAYEQDPLGAALTEAAIASLSRPVSRTSTFEQLLISQAIASALAESLAPALAKALTPEIMKAFGQTSNAEQHHKRSASAGGSQETARQQGNQGRPR
ncbi:hypothetical protein ORV05_29910 [Amycolatopsis cynarae]|uniref:DUF2267 domain-containing protein n=1 Tax=Amycolatopsis cynarae TaxID=2995223 RepID=A0ABY7AYT7_9PSEU|nr:hypothetical protein [Amycolatopsis sp. HUAS 11-8]WAL65091.1 hypothetical protein ORV05_29910 [Amycolatopsis sp. HUAS 11-8]